MIDRTYLIEKAAEMDIIIMPDQAVLFDRYAALLLSWNQKMNLTAITEPQEVCVKHFVDSLLLWKVINPQEGLSAIDVGCGAGFPSIPCAISHPEVEWTLLDSLQKRVGFLDTVIRELSLNAAAVHDRAEDAGKNKAFREQYDLVTARAVANMTTLCEYCLPMVQVGGVFAALKGYEIEEELSTAANAIKLLGGKVEQVQKFRLPDGSGRAIVTIRKIHETPAQYPRTSMKIKKKPL